MIMVPGAESRIFPGDILGVIGTDEEIQSLIPIVEATCEGESPIVDDVRLTSVRLTEDSPVVGKTVATSRIREDYEALLVAIQRDDKYMQPEASTVFSPDDVLWLVGDVHRLKSLN